MVTVGKGDLQAGLEVLIIWGAVVGSTLSKNYKESLLLPMEITEKKSLGQPAKSAPYGHNFKLCS